MVFHLSSFVIDTEKFNNEYLLENYTSNYLQDYQRWKYINNF